MSNRTFSDLEAAGIAKAYFISKVEQLSKSLDDLKAAELAKGIIPHKHSEGMGVGGGTEDMPGLNPPGKEDALKDELAESEESSSAEACKKCKLGKKMCKCVMAKDELVSNTSERHQVVHPESVLPRDTKSKQVNTKKTGSGGEIKEGKGKTVSTELSKAIAPPMAKPPSGKNMATAVPASKPAVAPKVAAPAKPLAPPAGAAAPGLPPAIKDEMDGSSDMQMGEESASSHTYKAPDGQHICVTCGEGATHRNHGAVPEVKETIKKALPNEAHVASPARGGASVGRDAFYSAASQGAFQPAGKTPPAQMIPLADKPKKPATMLPSVTGPVAKKPGIFGRLMGKGELSLQKDALTATPSPLVARPVAKPAAAGMFQAGSNKARVPGRVAPAPVAAAPKPSLASARVAPARLPVTTAIPKIKAGGTATHSVGGPIPGRGAAPVDPQSEKTIVNGPGEATVPGKPSNK